MEQGGTDFQPAWLRNGGQELPCMDTCPPTLNSPVCPWQCLSAYPADLRLSLELPARPVLEAPALLASSSPSFLRGHLLYAHLLNPLYSLKKLGDKGPMALSHTVARTPSLNCDCLAVALSVPPHWLQDGEHGPVELDLVHSRYLVNAEWIN